MSLTPTSKEMYAAARAEAVSVRQHLGLDSRAPVWIDTLFVSSMQHNCGSDPIKILVYQDELIAGGVLDADGMFEDRPARRSALPQGTQTERAAAKRKMARQRKPASQDRSKTVEDAQHQSPKSAEGAQKAKPPAATRRQKSKQDDAELPQWLKDYQQRMELEPIFPLWFEKWLQKCHCPCPSGTHD